MLGIAHGWFLTWTTYGSWLPGDARGFVGSIRLRQDQAPDDWHRRLENSVLTENPSQSTDEVRVVHNIPGTPYDGEIPPLERYSRSQLKGDPIQLSLFQARCFYDEVQRTVGLRGWKLLAAAVMSNHVHLVLVVPEEVGGEQLLKEFKSYGSRALNQQFGKPTSGKWWTKSGSTRWLSDEQAVLAATDYVRQQEFPLVVWVAGESSRASAGNP